MNFAVAPDHRLKIKKTTKGRQVRRTCQVTKEAMEHKGDCDINNNLGSQNDPKIFDKFAWVWFGFMEHQPF